MSLNLPETGVRALWSGKNKMNVLQGSNQHLRARVGRLKVLHVVLEARPSDFAKRL